MSNEREITYSFRIVGLSENDMALIRDLSELKAVSKYSKKMDKTVLLFDILENVVYKDFFDVFNKISKNAFEFGIWVSIVTDRDNDGLTIPEYVLNFYKMTSGKIDFSFVSGLGE